MDLDCRTEQLKSYEKQLSEKEVEIEKMYIDNSIMIRDVSFQTCTSLKNKTRCWCCGQKILQANDITQHVGLSPFQCKH